MVTGHEKLHAQSFTASERALIRAALQRYMREHRIGVPTLQRRIAQATGRLRDFDCLDDPPLVPRPTLQRFLKGERRTNDAMVVAYNEFVRQLVSNDAAAESGGLARALAAFYGERGQDKGLFALPEEKLRVYGAQGPVYCGELWIEGEEEGGVRVVRERVFNRDLSASGAVPGKLEMYEDFEGVMIGYSGFGVALLRNVMTGYPREHWLYDKSPLIASNCVEGLFRATREPPYRWSTLMLGRASHGAQRDE